MNYLTIKNWEQFQHYKDRNPPWIKLHRDLLRDYEFSCLQDASKLLLIEIWLLASQKNNHIPADERWLKRQLPFDGKINLKPLIENGFIELVQDASKTLAFTRSQEAYKSIRAEAEKEPRASFWQEKKLEKEIAAYRKMRTTLKAPVNEAAEKLLITALKKLHTNGHDMAQALNRATANSWKSVYPPDDENEKGRQTGHRTGQATVQTPRGRHDEAVARRGRQGSSEVMGADA